MASRKNNTDKNKIFISWSGDNSKEIAMGLKNVLENMVFKGSGLTCFVSTTDIASGADWWKKISNELNTCKVGILCITKENVNAPWIYYEAGAMIARNVQTIPLLISCSVDTLARSPFTKNQCLDFYNRQDFVKMVLDINCRLNLVSLEDEPLATLAIKGYNSINSELGDVLKNLKNIRFFNSEKYVYPRSVSTVEIDTIFICAPMSTLSKDEYSALYTYLPKLEAVLKEIGMKKVICPILKNEPGKLDGKAKAIKENFSSLKQVDSMLIIYPHKLPTSVLVEVGYGIALCKRMMIFYQDDLPFILDKAGENIKHVRSSHYNSFEEITETIRANGMTLFDRDW